MLNMLLDEWIWQKIWGIIYKIGILGKIFLVKVRTNVKLFGLGQSIFKPYEMYWSNEVYVRKTFWVKSP